MSQERRKVLLYLRPSLSVPECFADAKIESLPNRIRGDFSRTALLAGFALAEVDSRLPGILAASLANDTKPDTIRALLASFLEIQPAPPEGNVKLSSDKPTENAPQDPAMEAIKNFASSLPE